MEAAVIARHLEVGLVRIEVVLCLAGVRVAAKLSRLRGSVGVGYSVFSRAALSPLLLRLLWRVRLVAVVRHLVPVPWVSHDRAICSKTLD